MLTKDEKQYLRKISASKKVEIFAYDKKIPQIVDEFSQKINSIVPGLKVVHLGALALGISGQGDIDLSVLCERSYFDNIKKKLISVFGNNVPNTDLIE